MKREVCSLAIGQVQDNPEREPFLWSHAQPRSFPLGYAHLRGRRLRSNGNKPFTASEGHHVGLDDGRPR